MKATEVAVFTKRFMDRTAEIMAGRIVLDADDGKFQNNKRRLKYKSAEYKIRKKAGKAGGKGVSTDRNINFVNMRLTGDTLNRIKGVGTKNGFAITYDNGEIVQGNADRGYDLYGLSNKNMSFLATHLENEIERKIRLFEAQDQTLNIGKNKQ
jgi:hypothetical protein|tara:strand:+ start:8 stop:466 length:459 start_codon:yes stop_codon:yes gene_type:complete